MEWEASVQARDKERENERQRETHAKGLCKAEAVNQGLVE